MHWFEPKSRERDSISLRCFLQRYQNETVLKVGMMMRNFLSDSLDVRQRLSFILHSESSRTFDVLHDVFNLIGLEYIMNE